MNLPYLAKCLETNKLSDLVGVIDLVALDLNLALEDSIASGEVEIDREKDIVKILIDEKDIQPYHNPDLTNKLLRTIQHYTQHQTNATRGRLNSLIKDPMGQIPGYPTHEYIMSMQYLVDTKQVVEDIVDVVKSKAYPAHKFVFIGLPENAEVNAEWNAAAVNKWIAGFKKVK